MKKSVFGMLKTREEAEDVVAQLKAAGFTSNDISVLFPDTSGSRDFAHEHATKAPEGATTGGTTGFVIGGVLGWLAGIGSLAIPGLGPFIAAGPIMAALSGAAVGAAVGGIAGALIGMGIPEYEAKRYEAKIREGNLLISVHADNSDQVDRAKDILKKSRAEDIATSGEVSVPASQAEHAVPPRAESTPTTERPSATTPTAAGATGRERSDYPPAEGVAEPGQPAPTSGPRSVLNEPGIEESRERPPTP